MIIINGERPHLNILEKTSSICPHCFTQGKINKIKANIIQDNTTIWITKKCAKHGTFKEKISNDTDLYHKWIQYKTTGKNNPDINTNIYTGQTLYQHHTSQNILTNLLITTRNNTKTGTSDYIYEPTLNQIKQLRIQTRSKNPYEAQALQITGGEPTLRDDLFIIIRMAKEIGYNHIQLHTNGIKLANNPDYCQRLTNEQINTIYLSFDGTTEQTNPIIEQSYQAINNLKETTLKVVLVATLTHKNLQETNKIIQYGLENIDIIRGIQLQPLSYNVQTQNPNTTQRINPEDIFTTIEQEFNNHITRNDFYPAAFAQPISQFIESKKWHNQFELTSHPLCNAITYLFYENGKPIPITRFIDVEKIVLFIEKQSNIKGPLRKIRKGATFLKNASSFIQKDKIPTGLNIKRLISDITMWDQNKSPTQPQSKSLYIGIMWYQDPYNLDIERLKRCIIHYTTPKGIIPYCAYHGLGIGKKIHKTYGTPIKEWEKQTGQQHDKDISTNNSTK